jgi:hypothetical protein
MAAGILAAPFIFLYVVFSSTKMSARIPAAPFLLLFVFLFSENGAGFPAGFSGWPFSHQPKSKKGNAEKGNNWWTTSQGNNG